MNNFGVLLKKLRTNAGLTQKDFAAKLNTTFTTVSNWENNKRYPDIMTLRDIAQVLNVPYDVLLNPTETLEKLSVPQELPILETDTSDPSPVKILHPKSKWIMIICISLCLFIIIGIILVTIIYQPHETKYEFIEARTNVETKAGTGLAYELVYYIDSKDSPEALLNHSESLAEAWKEDIFNDCNEDVFIVSYYVSYKDINNWDEVYFQAYTLNNPPQ